jgi:hypothetical protein
MSEIGIHRSENVLPEPSTLPLSARIIMAEEVVTDSEEEDPMFFLEPTVAGPVPANVKRTILAKELQHKIANMPASRKRKLQEKKNRELESDKKKKDDDGICRIKWLTSRSRTFSDSDRRRFSSPSSQPGTK